MCRVSMIGVHGELGECMLIGVIDKLKREILFRLGLGVCWLAAVANLSSTLMPKLHFLFWLL